MGSAFEPAQPRYKPRGFPRISGQVRIKRYPAGASPGGRHRPRVRLSLDACDSRPFRGPSVAVEQNRRVSWHAKPRGSDRPGARSSGADSNDLGQVELRAPRRTFAPGKAPAPATQRLFWRHNPAIPEENRVLSLSPLSPQRKPSTQNRPEPDTGWASLTPCRLSCQPKDQSPLLIRHPEEEILEVEPLLDYVNGVRAGFRPG